MSDLDLLRELDATWPPPRRGLFASRPPTDVTPAVEAALRRVAEVGTCRWTFELLGLAWECSGALRACLLDTARGLLDRLPARQWVRLDEMSRAPWRTPLRRAWDRPEGAADELAAAGLQAWFRSASFESLREHLGDHAVVRVLASMHPDGHVRQAAIDAMTDDAGDIPALLIRVNDWAAPVRESALVGLHALADGARVDGWLRALPLVTRLEACGRAVHDRLLVRVGDLFREAPARDRLMETIHASDVPSARAAAALALRVFGPSDRGALAAMLRSSDTRVRYGAVDPASPAIDGDLVAIALTDPVPAIRRRALDVLRARRDPEFHAHLRASCFDRSPAIREVARFHLDRAGRFDEAALTAEARDRIAAGRGDLLGALGFLCDVEGEPPAEIAALCSHPRGSVRLLAKRRLLRATHGDGPVDARLLDDPSAKVARRLIGLLRGRGIEPDLAVLWRRVQESDRDAEARAWLGTLAKGELWATLPHLVRAMDDHRQPVASLAHERVDVLTKRTFRGYVSPDPRHLVALAGALRTCRDPRADTLIAWVRAVTGRADWPAAAP